LEVVPDLPEGPKENLSETEVSEEESGEP